MLLSRSPKLLKSRLLAKKMPDGDEGKDPDSLRYGTLKEDHETRGSRMGRVSGRALLVPALERGQELDDRSFVWRRFESRSAGVVVESYLALRARIKGDTNTPKVQGLPRGTAVAGIWSTFQIDVLHESRTRTSGES